MITRKIGGENKGGELAKYFIGDVWIKAGTFVYKVWIESGNVNLQFYDRINGTTQEDVRVFAMGQEYKVGRKSRESDNDYDIDDNILSRKHFSVKIEATENSEIHQLKIIDRESLNGTKVTWDAHLLNANMLADYFDPTLKPLEGILDEDGMLLVMGNSKDVENDIESMKAQIQAEKVFPFKVRIEERRRLEEGIQENFNFEIESLDEFEVNDNLSKEIRDVLILSLEEANKIRGQSMKDIVEEARLKWGKKGATDEEKGDDKEKLEKLVEALEAIIRGVVQAKDFLTYPSFYVTTDAEEEIVSIERNRPFGSVGYEIQIGIELGGYIKEVTMQKGIPEKIRKKIMRVIKQYNQDEAMYIKEQKIVKSVDKSTGGINLDSAMMVLNVKRDADGAMLPMDLQDPGFGQNIIGFTPVIVDTFIMTGPLIQPLSRLPAEKSNLSYHF